MAGMPRKRQSKKGAAKKRAATKLTDLAAGKKARDVKGGALYPHRGGSITDGASNT